MSDLEFYGRKPIVRPVLAQGSVVNHAGALVLNGTARSELDLVCDRCGKEFSREKVVALDMLLADELEQEDSEDEIFFWTAMNWIWTSWSPRPLSLRWIQRTFAQKTAKGCAPSVEPI